MIDIDQARDLLARAVATQGRDFVYNPDNIVGVCRYEPDTDLPPDNPRAVTGCLIGVALDLAGETRHYGATLAVSSLTYKFPGMMTDRVAEYFQVAQTAQDHGDSWGTAYDLAEAYYQTRLAPLAA